LLAEVKTMNIPKDYKSDLDLLNTQIAIKICKDNFERSLADNLGLTRVSAPLMVDKASGLNDNLNGYERPISFDVPYLAGREFEIVHSLAKWKRMALKQYGLRRFKGIYTDMNAIRRDEKLGNIHSVYVDQWDWEKVIEEEDRTLEFLYGTVDRIMKALRATQDELLKHYPELPKNISDEDVFYITSQELADMYPDLDGKGREYAICKLHPTVFISQIGDKLKDGKPHDGRAPDYDDWQLNGDLLVWYDLLQMPIELSSMGIRVNKESMIEQLIKSNNSERMALPYHQDLLNDKLPLTMGGGIGQSRLCMVLLNKAHIGEVQASIWPKDMIEACRNNQIELL
jgi:aspartate--ammonia ligase